jgi:hypothetical protein
MTVFINAADVDSAMTKRNSTIKIVLNNAGKAVFSVFLWTFFSLWF